MSLYFSNKNMLCNVYLNISLLHKTQNVEFLLSLLWFHTFPLDLKFLKNTVNSIVDAISLVSTYIEIKNHIVVLWCLSNSMYLLIIIQWGELMFKMAAGRHCIFRIETYFSIREV